MNQISLNQRLNHTSADGVMRQLACIRLSEVLQPLCRLHGDSYLIDIYCGCILEVLKDETSFAQAIKTFMEQPEKKRYDLLYHILIEPFV